MKKNTLLKQLFFGIMLLILPGLSQAKPFTENGDSTVTDQKTGLIWMKTTPSTLLNWESSLNYCEGLNLANHSDWRLPNIKELYSIVDMSQSDIIDTTAFPGTGSYYWSSTTDVNNTSYAWGLNFTSGTVYSGNGSKSIYSGPYFRCVRGGS
jgi:hypothetical protein